MPVIYDRTFQETMLGHLLRCKPMVRHLADGKVSQTDFDLATHRAIVNSAREVLEAEGVRALGWVPKSILMIPLREKIGSGEILKEEVAALCLSIANIYGMELTPSYFETQLEPYTKFQRLKRAQRDADPDDPEGTVARLQEAVSSSRFSSAAPLMPLQNVRLGEPETPVPCGLMAIDSRMRGGLGLKRTMLICGFTGIGKTSLAINMAWGSASQGYPARIVQTELPATETMQRIYACVARQSYDLVQYASDEVDELAELGLNFTTAKTRTELTNDVSAWLADLPPTLLNNLDLYDYSEKTCTLQAVEDDIHRDQDRNPENPPKVLDFDWLECIDLPATPDRAKKAMQIPVREMRHKLEKVSEEFTRLCVKENIAGRMYTQSNFDAEGEAVVRMSNKSEGKGASRRYSWFLGIGATREDLARDILTITAGKSRNGRLFGCQVRRALHEQRFEDLEAAAEQAELESYLSQAEFAPQPSGILVPTN